MTTQEEHIKLFKALMIKLDSKSFYVKVDYSEEMPKGFIRRLHDNLCSQLSFRLYSGKNCKLIVTREQRNNTLIPDRLSHHHVVNDANCTQVTKYVLNLSTLTIEDVVDWFCTYFYN